MLRWSVSLAVAIGLLAVGISGIVWLESAMADKVEQLRLVRAQHQQLEQQLNLLQSSGIAPLIDALQEDLDALQIKLVEVMTQQPPPAGVLKIAYEQIMMPQALDDGVGTSISVLRLELNLTVQHAGGLLDMLDRINRSVRVWPHETRACELQRLPRQILSARCIVDFYHWTYGSEQESVQSGQWRSSSLAWT